MEQATSIDQPAVFRPDAVLFRYLAAMKTGKLVLWCYLIWYVVMAALYFDPSPRLWLSSLGISSLIGVALLLATTSGWEEIRTLNRWQIFRMFFLPICTSSFAALIKGRGFILVFSPVLAENALAIGCCAGFCGIVFIVKRIGQAAPVIELKSATH